VTTTVEPRRVPATGTAGSTRLQAPVRVLAGRAAHPWSRRDLLFVLIPCSVGLGVAAGLAPLVLLAGIAAVGLVALILVDLTVGLAAFTVIQFFAMVPFVGGQELTVVKGTGALLAISWALVILRGRLRAPAAPRTRPENLITRFPVAVVLLLLFLIWGGLSFLWAVDPDAVLVDLSRYALNFVLFAIIPTAVSRPRHALWIAGAIVLGTTIAACSGSFFSTVNDPNRLEGAFGDPNDLAAALIPGVLLAFALIGTVRSRWLQLLFVGCGLVGVYATLLTASRGGLIGLAVALAVLWLLVPGWRTALSVGAGSMAVGGGLFYLLAAPAELAERISQPGDGSGRLDIWLLGWRVFADRPFLGAGLGNFTSATPLYLVEPGLVARADRILTMPKIAHNMYLSMLTELGLVGFALFVGIVGISLVAMFRANQIFTRIALPGMSLLSAAFSAGLTGLLTADFFLSGQHEKHLWLLLGLGPALLLMARREAANRVSPVVPVPAR
jgi:O-antigen ligase